MLNSITLMGRFTANPEVKYTSQKQTPVCTFTIACERDIKNADGKFTVDFIDCTAWNSSAEFVGKYFHKGDMAAIKGRLENNTWEDKNGSKRVTAQIRVEGIYFAGANKSAAQETKTAEVVPIDDADGDLPF